MDNVDEEFEEWYADAKIYFDGSHYIGIPKTTNPARRRKRREEIITVSQTDGKFTLEKEVKSIPHGLIEITEDDPLFYECPFDDIIEAKEEKNVGDKKESAKKSNKRKTTRKQIFEELFEQYRELKKAERREAILRDMSLLFKTIDEAISFVDENLNRKARNIIMRRVRFVRKAFNQDFNYFVTFTFDDKKQTEVSFKKRLLECLRHYAHRRGWKYMGVWERGKKTKRLHFHALVYIPKGQEVGEMEFLRNYNYKKHRVVEIQQNTFFADRFGLNEFERLDKGPLFGRALAYVLKYLEKTGEKIVYSRGLYQYFISDIHGEDALCKIGQYGQKIVLSDKFTLWDEGVKVGTVSPETIVQMRKCA